MPQHPSSISPHFEIQGHGIISRGEEQAEVNFTLSRNKYDHASTWDLQAVPSNPSMSIRRLFDGDVRTPVRLEGVFARGRRQLAIPNLILARATEEVLHGKVFSFDTWTPPASFPPVTQSITVRFTETPLALSEIGCPVLRANGVVEAGEASEPVSWVGDLGYYQFSIWYTGEDVDVHGVKARLTVPTPTLRIGVSESHRTADPHSLMDAAVEDLRDFVRLVGLLGRQRIAWTHIEIATWREASHERQVTERFREAGDLTRPEYLTPLLNPSHLQDAISDGIFSRLRSSPIKTEIGRSIAFLLSSQEERTVFGELAFLAAFTAFETVVNAYSEHEGFDLTISGNKQKRLLSAVRATVRDFAQQNGIEEWRTQAILEKTPELKRVGFVSRVLRTLAEKRVSMEDLWPEQVEPGAAISEISDLRNQLVHSGQGVKTGSYLRHQIRLNLLTERLLYNLIGGKQEWLNPLAGWHHDWLAKEEGT